MHADLCSSLTDFWSRRWNLTAGNALRLLVYDPISEGRLIRRAGTAPTTSRAVRRAGVIASFIVSGCVHELIFWCALFRGPLPHTEEFFPTFFFGSSSVRCMRSCPVQKSVALREVCLEC